MRHICVRSSRFPRSPRPGRTGILITRPTTLPVTRLGGMPSRALYVTAQPDDSLANVYDERVGFWRQQLRCPRCRVVLC